MTNRELPRTVPITWKASNSPLPFLLPEVVVLFQKQPSGLAHSMHHAILGLSIEVVTKADCYLIPKTTKKELIKVFAKIQIKDLLQICLLPFNVHEGNQVTQAQLDSNEPLQASKVHPFILFLSVQTVALMISSGVLTLNNVSLIIELQNPLPLLKYLEMLFQALSQYTPVLLHGIIQSHQVQPSIPLTQNMVSFPFCQLCIFILMLILLGTLS